MSSGDDWYDHHVGADDAGFANPAVGSSSRPDYSLVPTLDVCALIAAWWNRFGPDPIPVSALVHGARSVPDLAVALGSPMPSARSVGRLLAARVGQRWGNLRLVRCPGRLENCALWRVVRADLV